MQCGTVVAGVSVPASNFKVVSKTCRSMNLTWNRGNGQLCMVTCRKASVPIAYPNDGWQYFPDNRYGLGTDLGNENYCIFSGLDSAISVRNLDENTSYIFEIFEFDYNPFIYLMAESPHLKDSTHWFSGKFTTTVLNNCKVRNKVELKVATKASFPVEDYEWRFAFDTLYGKEHVARMEASGEN